MQDVTFAPDAAWILVHGKGRKQREVALGKKARLALRSMTISPLDVMGRNTA